VELGGLSRLVSRGPCEGLTREQATVVGFSGAVAGGRTVRPRQQGKLDVDVSHKGV
jgi:hypothetical protein